MSRLNLVEHVAFHPALRSAGCQTDRGAGWCTSPPLPVVTEGNMPETVIIQTPTDQDEIVISLTEHKSVTHDTVRINVTVNAQRDSTASETDFRNKIRAVLGNFIPSAEWRFTSVNRQRGQTRFEQVVVSAVTRVKESENVQLAERANSASEQGMEIVGPQAHFACTTERVREINRELRIALVKQAQEECNEYNKSRGDYRSE